MSHEVKEVHEPMTIAKLKQLSERWSATMRDVAKGIADKSALSAIDAEMLMELIPIAAEMSKVVEAVAGGNLVDYACGASRCVLCGQDLRNEEMNEHDHSRHKLECAVLLARKLQGITTP